MDLNELFGATTRWAARDADVRAVALTDDDRHAQPRANPRMRRD